MSRKRKIAQAAGPAVSVSESRKTEKPVWLACAALLCLTLIAYANSFSAGFALDSHMLALGDPRIRELNASNLRLIVQHTYWWPNGEAGLYRPLTTLSYLFNYAVLGNADTPIGYHVVNFLLHAANVILVFALSLKLITGPTRLRISVAIAGLWAVHPVLTESVTNVAGRADLLSAMGVLGAFWLYLKASVSIGTTRTWSLIGMAVATGFGVLSKESAVVVPGVVLLHEFLLRRPKDPGTRFLRTGLRLELLAIFLPIALMLLARTLVLSNSLPAEWPFVDNPIRYAGFWVGRLTALDVLARYLALALWPARLSADYSYSQVPFAGGSTGDWFAWMAMLGAIVSVAVLYRRNRLAFFFASFAFLALLPGSNLLFPIGTIMGERLLYLPLVGIIAALVAIVEPAAAKWKISFPVVSALVGLIAAGLCVRTIVRNLDWRSDRTMASASVRTSPQSFKVHRLLAAQLLESDPSEAGVTRAMNEADKSVSILDGLPDRLSVAEPWTLAANCHLAKGNLLPESRARTEYERAVKLATRSISVDKASEEA